MKPWGRSWSVCTACGQNHPQTSAGCAVNSHRAESGFSVRRSHLTSGDLDEGAIWACPCTRESEDPSILLLPLLDSCTLACMADGSSKDVMFGGAHLGLRSHLAHVVSLPAAFSPALCPRAADGGETRHGQLPGLRRPADDSHGPELHS